MRALILHEEKLPPAPTSMPFDSMQNLYIMMPPTDFNYSYYEDPSRRSGFDFSSVLGPQSVASSAASICVTGR